MMERKNRMTIEEINSTEEKLNHIKQLIIEMKAERDLLARDLKDCRNELCLRCGQYKTKHLGSCDGCRWK